jgi:hypothetical protein
MRESQRLYLVALGLLVLISIIVAVGCDSYARATAAPVIHLTVPTQGPTNPGTPINQPGAVVIVDVAPEPNITNLIYPPSDEHIPFNEQQATTEQPCEDKHANGRGRGHGDGKHCKE